MTGRPGPAYRPTQDLAAVVVAGPSWRMHDCLPGRFAPPSAAEMLDVLGCAEELAARLAGARWVHVRDCRRSGASWEQIGRVIEMTAVDAHAGFRAWIDRGREALGVASYPRDLDGFAAPDEGMDGSAAVPAADLA